MKALAFALLLVGWAIPVYAVTIPEQYVSCRCCCKEKPEDIQTFCLYAERGDSIASIIEDDRAWESAQTPRCPVEQVCTEPKRYTYCDEGR